MAKAYKTTDRIKVQVEDIELSVSPLSKAQKASMQGFMIKASKGDMAAAMEGVFLAVKYAVKGHKGIIDANDEPLALEFENGELSDDCVNDLLNMELGEKISQVCMALLAKVPNEIVDANGKPIEGIRIIKKENSEGK